MAFCSSEPPGKDRPFHRTNVSGFCGLPSRPVQWKPIPQGESYKLLAGTGTPSLSETIALTHSAFDLGCEGVVVLPPYYYRKASDDGLFLYFSEIIHKAVPADGYLLGYHIPGTAGIGFSTDLLARLKEAFPDQFAGYKRFIAR